MDYLYTSKRSGTLAQGSTRSGLLPFYQTLQKAMENGGAGTVSVMQAFQQTAFLRRCVLLRARTLAATPYTIRQGDKVDFDSDDAGDLPSDLVMMEGFRTMLYQHEADIALAGWSFALKETGEPITAPGHASRPPVALSWLKPSSMRVDPQHDIEGGRLASYTRTTATASGKAVEERVPVERLVVIREPSPYHEAGKGTSDADAARTAASALYAYNEFIEGHLSGGLLRDMLFSVGDPSKQGRVPKDVEPAEKKLTRWFRRRKKADKTAQIVSDLLQVHELGEGLQGLSDKNLTDTLRQDVAAACNVPYALVMDQGEMAYHALLGKYIQLYQLCLFFDMALIKEAYESQLLGPMDYSLHWETSRIEALQWAEVQKAQATVPLVQAGVMTTDEAREQHGLDTARHVGGDGLPADVILRQGF